jgi:hypothetical protein
MARFAAQPTEEDALQQFGIEPVRLGPAMLARDSDTGRVDDMSFNASSPQPPRQPKAVPAGFVGHRDPTDHVARLGRFVAPAMQQLEQGRFVRRKFLQRLAVDPRNNAGDEPARLADLNDGKDISDYALSSAIKSWVQNRNIRLFLRV